MKSVSLFTFVLLGVAIAGSCFAQVQTVPEVDASSGGIALSLVVGAMLWLQQSRKRR
jgi:hypothetical protein